MKHRYISTRLHAFTFQKMVIFIVAALRSSNPAFTLSSHYFRLGSFNPVVRRRREWFTLFYLASASLSLIGFQHSLYHFNIVGCV